MDGIETQVLCPECGKEISMLLEPQEIPMPLLEMMKGLRLPVGNENVYKGQEKCSCGKTVKITFVVEAVSNDQPLVERIFMGGIQP